MLCTVKLQATDLKHADITPSVSSLLHSGDLKRPQKSLERQSREEQCAMQVVF